MTIAITGATSMLGVATINECIKKQYYVIAFVRKNSENLIRLPKSNLIKIISCDLNEICNLDVNELQADLFIHLGWAFTDKNGRNDVSKQIRNIEYTIDAIQLAKRMGCKKLIGAGSQAEYGIINEKLKSTTKINPIVPYGVAKFSAGKLANIECKKIGMEFNWIRILSVYGKYDNKNSLLSYAINCAKNNKLIEMTKGEQIWDYLNEKDAGEGILSIAEKGINGKVYILGSGTGRELKEYILEMISIINPNCPIGFGMIPYSETQPMYLVADITELTNDTGWVPKIDFVTGIKSIID